MQKTFPILQTERLSLRQPDQRDTPALFAIHRDEAVMRYYGMEPFQTAQEARDEIDWFRALWTESTGIRWTITLKEKDRYIGDAGFHKYEQAHSRAELGYKLVKAHWGQGIMSEALTEVLKYGFATMGLNRIEALVDPRNIASARLLEKLGFATEGILREYEFEREQFVDLAMMSLLKKEWQGQ